MATAAIGKTYPYARDQRFFTRMAIGMAAFIVFGFAQWALRGFVSPTTVPVWVHLHGLAMLSWLGLLIIQNLLVGSGNIALHRKLGWLGLALVLMIAGLGMFTGRMAVELHRVPPFFTDAYFLALTHAEAVTFPLIVGAGIAMRRQTQWHRRLMLGATIIVMEPAFGRLVPAPLLGPVLTALTGLALQLAVLGIIARHDMRETGTIHPATRVLALVLLLLSATVHALSVFPPFVSLAQGIAAGG
ncbi:adenylate cyclase [Novosphingobium sp. MMS21-SN21R]|uniref:adenylate cyclase n=1 Tax=Novosphingobium sp. MMS21-SN21R TaxID=2969298 RepID=UPI002886B1CF|nr:adenylate cyclase [Novosphingobium sp. MMS21-SN21R]MDT0506537.1 adenylate cyclase [Novosphingobium sp. MMS21-SN21R]